MAKYQNSLSTAFWKRKRQMGNSAFEHAQNAQIRLMPKVSSWPMLTIHTFCNIQ